MKPVCLITGAGGLFGNALCDELSNDYNVVAAYKTSVPKHSSQLVKLISPSNQNSIYCIQGDLTKKEDLRRIVEVALAKFGQIDVVINNAVNNTIRGPLLDLFQTDDYAAYKINLNTIAPFQLISYIYQHCWKVSPNENHSWNRNVLNISSIAGIKLYDTSEAFYSASKSAMNMLTLHLAHELVTYKVRANAICPAGFNKDGATNLAAQVKKILQGSETGQIITDLN